MANSQGWLPLRSPGVWPTFIQEIEIETTKKVRGKKEGKENEKEIITTQFVCGGSWEFSEK